jgi:hypothetical protein
MFARSLLKSISTKHIQGQRATLYSKTKFRYQSDSKIPETPVIEEPVKPKTDYLQPFLVFGSIAALGGITFYLM